MESGFIQSVFLKKTFEVLKVIEITV